MSRAHEISDGDDKFHLVVTTNQGFEKWRSEWTIRRTLEKKIPDCKYEIKSLRRSSEWQFKIFSDLDRFVAALSEMKLDTELKERVVDLHIRNLPWGWRVSDIEEMIHAQFVGSKGVQVFEKRGSNQSNPQPEWALHRGSARFQVLEEKWETSEYAEIRSAVEVEAESYELRIQDVSRPLYVKFWSDSPKPRPRPQQRVRRVPPTQNSKVAHDVKQPEAVQVHPALPSDEIRALRMVIDEQKSIIETQQKMLSEALEVTKQNQVMTKTLQETVKCLNEKLGQMLTHSVPVANSTTASISKMTSNLNQLTIQPQVPSQTPASGSIQEQAVSNLLSRQNPPKSSPSIHNQTPQGIDTPQNLDPNPVMPPFRHLSATTSNPKRALSEPRDRQDFKQARTEL